MSTIEVGDLLYEYRLPITGLTEYGFSFNALISGAAAPPPEGARFDVAFRGEVAGRLSGSVAGVDYLLARADGRFDMHIHAEITAADGQKVSLHADGVATQRPGTPMVDLRENVTLSTSAAGHTWVNRLQIWGIGTVDLAQQVIHVKGYAA